MAPLTAVQRDAAVRDLCGRLFHRPAMLAHTATHRVDQPLHFARHTHDDLLQFDLLAGCVGRAWRGGRWVALRGGSALVAYPGDEHGYDLEEGQPPSRVYHLRLRVRPDWPVVAGRVYPTVTTGLGSVEAVASAMRVVMRLGVIDAVRPPLLLARLCEALTCWPGTSDSGAPLVDTAPEEEARGLEAAVDLIEHRLTGPPSSEELAEVAHFSVRHFARRFRAAYGCTPHDYITARRFALARQLLSQERLSVTHVADELGFGSVATFSRWFSQQAGLSPTAFRENPTLM